ncbi:MAG TPA: IspD/TarI family cytidylyltransferase [Streptosporangiaceae bacterium]|nr:IspD/TarI family cytidylyltransferase [Streptosporangiaceae bacterium]
MRTVAVVLAGGAGNRFGPGPPKQLQLLRGRTLLDRCVSAFDRAPGVDEVLVVTPAELTADVGTQLQGYAKLAAVIGGGAERTDSTQRAIAWLTARFAPAGQDEDCKVLFHDAARPLVDQRIVADCVSALDSWDAIGVVVPSADTIVEIADGAFGRVLPRDSLARCQTPQGFRLAVIRRAYQLAAADPEFTDWPATDDCGVVRRYLPDIPIGVVRGSERNIKITYGSDLAVAETLLDQDGPAG